MNEVPQVIPVSDLRNKHREVFSRLEDGPVILAQRSKAAAVLVSVAEWDRRAKRLRELEWRERVRRSAREVRESQEPDLSFDAFMAELNAYHEQP